MGGHRLEKPAMPNTVRAGVVAATLGRMQKTRVVTSLAVLAFSLALTGCVESKPTIDFGPRTIEATAPSATCKAAGDSALAGIRAVYDYLNAAYTEAEVDGTISSEESAALLEVENRASDDIQAAVAPTFSDCSTASEWIGLVRANPGIVESTEAEAITDQTLEWHCPYYADTPVCDDAAAMGIEFQPIR